MTEISTEILRETPALNWKNQIGCKTGTSVKDRGVNSKTSVFLPLAATDSITVKETRQAQLKHNGAEAIMSRRYGGEDELKMDQKLLIIIGKKSVSILKIQG